MPRLVERRHSYIHHPLVINSFRHWLRIAGSGIDRSQYLRALGVTLGSPFIAPLRMAEQVLYGRRVRETRIEHPPLFILGHWRTGTTHLHNLLSRDPLLGYVTTFQTLAPAAFFVGRKTLRPFVASNMPEKRMMDNMPLSPDLPQEEEFAVCNLCEQSFYLGWYFPRRMRELFDKFVLFDGVDDAETESWRQAFISVLKKATLDAQGRRLVLKSPVNTGRVPALLELFPDAKFVHIHRSPYKVFKSTLKLYRSTIDLVSFQDFTDAEIEENVLLFYRKMMQRFIKEREIIPAGNFVEIRFEDLVKHPLETLEELYAKLSLPGWNGARPQMETYLASQHGYEKNRYVMSRPDLAKIEAHWQFAIDEWGYDRPETA